MMMSLPSIPLADVVIETDGPTTKGPSIGLSAARGTTAGLLLGLAIVGAGLLLARAIDSYATVEDEAMICLLSAIMIGLLCEMKVAMLATLANIVAFDFFFVPPRFAFARSDLKNALTFLAILMVGGVVSGLSQRLRGQERAARLSARIASALYEMNVELATVSDPRRMCSSAARHIEQLFSAKTCVLFPTRDAHFRPQGGLCTEAAALAEQAFSQRECRVGATRSDYNVWVPILGTQEPLGAVGLRLAEPFSPQSESARLLCTFARELATAIERTRLFAEVHRSQLDAESERVRNTLLSSLSHDLKTPLSSIVAAATSLKSHGAALDEAGRAEVLSGIAQQGERLNRQIQNLLSIARLESPTIELRRTPQSFEEILATTLERFEPLIGERPVRLDVLATLPNVLVEPALIEQVLSNLIENALHYSPADGELSISALADAAWVTVEIADRGPGLPEEEWERVFEKFYRGPRASRHKDGGGVGLGLAICRAIVRAHGGTIRLQGRPGGGTAVAFTLPAVDMGRAIPEGEATPS